jgi:hypothetical protein
MTVETFGLRAKFARRFPDPNFHESLGVEHHLMLVNCCDLPQGLPLEANARRPNTRKQIYKQVEQSLLDMDGEPGTFHLKNKGIVIVANSVKQGGAKDQYLVELDRTSQGILDGGHTYDLITSTDPEELPAEQHVFVQIRTAVPRDWVPEISQGLNTSVQVQEMSLQNLAGEFAWMKKELKSTPYISEVAWSENDPGAYSARDIVALMYLMNPILFPGSEQHPIAGYEKKSSVLKDFKKSPGAFHAQSDVLRDVLYLHDLVAFTAADLYNEGKRKAGEKGRGGGLSFVKRAKRKPFHALFMNDGKTYDTMLEDAALYPILAAFRVFLKKHPTTGQLQWEGGFGSVQAAWKQLAPELIRATIHTAAEVGRSKNSIGKSRLHWDGLYKTLENYKLRKAAGR